MEDLWERVACELEEVLKEKGWGRGDVETRANELFQILAERDAEGAASVLALDAILHGAEPPVSRVQALRLQAKGLPLEVGDLWRKESRA
jgi:hypothetical protein